MRTVLLSVLAALAIAPTAAAAPTPIVSGRVIDRPVVKGAEVRVPLLATSGGRPRLATLAVPRSALRNPGRLRLGDRLRGRNHRWLRVTARSSGPSFTTLTTLVSGTRTAAQEALADLRRVQQLPPGTLTGPSAVSAGFADAQGLRERLNLLDARIADLRPGLDGAIAAVQAAYAGDASRFRSLRRKRDARVADMTAARDAGARARQAIADATYVLDRKLAEVPPGGVAGVEIPVSTVATASEVITLVVKTLDRLP